MTRRPSNDLRHRVAVAIAEPDCGIFAMSVEPSTAHGKSPIWLRPLRKDWKRTLNR